MFAPHLASQTTGEEAVAGVHNTSDKSLEQAFSPLVKGRYSKGAQRLGVCMSDLGRVSTEPLSGLTKLCQLVFCESCPIPGT